mmetsp:Transcript_27102/g.94021  ORF Transcript_27102/g.94021 Transcript_27102/m.94021 type:complete len:858 (-) Transcript_27102:210-2783(-)
MAAAATPTTESHDGEGVTASGSMLDDTRPGRSAVGGAPAANGADDEAGRERCPGLLRGRVAPPRLVVDEEDHSYRVPSDADDWAAPRVAGGGIAWRVPGDAGGTAAGSGTRAPAPRHLVAATLLSDEVGPNIYAFLFPIDVVRAAGVCRGARRVATAAGLWTFLLTRHASLAEAIGIAHPDDVAAAGGKLKDVPGALEAVRRVARDGLLPLSAPSAPLPPDAEAMREARVLRRRARRHVRTKPRTMSWRRPPPPTAEEEEAEARASVADDEFDEAIPGPAFTWGEASGAPTAGGVEAGTSWFWWFRGRLAAWCDGYVAACRRCPRPTEEQIEAFVHKVASDHSWYKHLSYASPTAHIAYFHPSTNCTVETTSRGRTVVTPAAAGDFASHYLCNWSTTQKWQGTGGLQYRPAGWQHTTGERGWAVMSPFIVRGQCDGLRIPPWLVDVGRFDVGSGMHVSTDESWWVRTDYSLLGSRPDRYTGHGTGGMSPALRVRMRLREMGERMMLQGVCCALGLPEGSEVSAFEVMEAAVPGVPEEAWVEMWRRIGNSADWERRRPALDHTKSSDDDESGATGGAGGGRRDRRIGPRGLPIGTPVLTSDGRFELEGTPFVDILMGTAYSGSPSLSNIVDDQIARTPMTSKCWNAREDANLEAKPLQEAARKYRESTGWKPEEDSVDVAATDAAASADWDDDDASSHGEPPRPEHVPAASGWKYAACDVRTDEVLFIVHTTLDFGRTRLAKEAGHAAELQCIREAVMRALDAAQVGADVEHGSEPPEWAHEVWNLPFPGEVGFDRAGRRRERRHAPPTAAPSAAGESDAPGFWRRVTATVAARLARFRNRGPTGGSVAAAGGAGGRG